MLLQLSSLRMFFLFFFSFHKMKVGTQQMVCLADEYEPLLSPSAVILQTAAGNIEEKEEQPT